MRVDLLRDATVWARFRAVSVDMIHLSLLMHLTQGTFRSPDRIARMSAEIEAAMPWSALVGRRDCLKGSDSSLTR